MKPGTIASKATTRPIHDSGMAQLSVRAIANDAAAASVGDTAQP